MRVHPFRNSIGHLRSGWWVLAFFLILALLLVPFLLMARQNEAEIPVLGQAALVILATWICQMIRRRPMAEIVGTLDLR